jgi:hypothetical protein
MEERNDSASSRINAEQERSVAKRIPRMKPDHEIFEQLLHSPSSSPPLFSFKSSAKPD